MIAGRMTEVEIAKEVSDIVLRAWPSATLPIKNLQDGQVGYLERTKDGRVVPEVRGTRGKFWTSYRCLTDLVRDGWVVD